MRVVAHAKLTLSLRVLGLRSDGYHEIEALCVSITQPHDVLELTPSTRTSLQVTGPYRRGVPTDASNLAVQAADRLGVRVAMKLHKGIPAEAGLGGGSADAAAVLAAFGGGDVHDIAAELGSDVPFCLRGGAAWMRGRGESLEPAGVPALAVVVAVPGFGCSTPAVYGAWDALGGPRGRTVEVEGLPPLRNDLEPAAEHVEPRVAAFRHAIEDATGRPALLAGSGAAYAVVVGDREARGTGVVADLQARTVAAVGGTVFAATTATSGVVFGA